MKAYPYKIETKDGRKARIPCDSSEAEEIALNLPGPTGTVILPVIQKGSRDKASKERGKPVWTWNGDTEKPTLKPSLMVNRHHYDHAPRCHTWITDGKVQFLNDSKHEHKGKTLDLLDIPDYLMS